MLKDTLGRSVLNHMTGPHDDDLIAQGAYDFEVVTNKQIGQLVALLEIA